MISPSDLGRAVTDRSLVFEAGTFNDYIVKRVVFGESFFICDVHASTDIADEMARDIYSWALSEWGYEQKDDGYWAQAYASEIEFTLDVHARTKFQALMSFGDKFTKLVESYGNECGPFSIERISFAADTTASVALRPIPFSIERRNGTPFNLGIWYSAAPLKTEDHLKILEEMTAP